jgi:hypothetical protein
MIGISLSTYKRIEQGNPNVELGSFIKVLWHLNILDGLAEVLPKSKKMTDLQRVRLKKVPGRIFN